MVTIHYLYEDGTSYEESRFETQEEANNRAEEREVAREASLKREASYLDRANLETLNCDKCEQPMGLMYANDLEGSRFYHDSCIA